MTAVLEAPGLSELLTWPTDHLTKAADHWEALGERSFGVAHGVWSDALTVDWRGEAADALRTETHADMQTTSAVVDQLQAAAGIARRGASDLDAARTQIQYVVQDVHSAGFVVDEDLSILDEMAGGSASERDARQAAAQAFADNIGGRAAQLVNLDAQVAGKITAAMAGVGNAFPPVNGRQAHAAAGAEAPGRHGGVRPVTWTTDKPPETPKPPEPPPKGPSAADMRKVLEQLPRGSKDNFREVRTPQDLENLKRWMTEHGADMQNRYPEPGMGRWRQLPDGSAIGERSEAGSTGQKALDIDLRGADGGASTGKSTSTRRGEESPRFQPPCRHRLNRPQQSQRLREQRRLSRARGKASFSAVPQAYRPSHLSCPSRVQNTIWRPSLARTTPAKAGATSATEPPTMLTYIGGDQT